MFSRATLLALFTAGALMLSGCANLDYPTIGASTDSATEDSDGRPDDGPGADDYPVRAFPQGAFYELLVAEFAGVRGDYELALDKYLEQARNTRDPNVTRRAARTASYLNDRDALKELSELWVDIEPENQKAKRLVFYYRSVAGDIEGAFDYGKRLFLEGDSEALKSLPALTAKSDDETRAKLLAGYTALARDYPNNKDILLGKIQLEGQQGETQAALETGKALLKLEPKNESARLTLAQLLYKEGEQKQAMSTLKKGLSINPESKKLRLQLIRFIAETDVAEARRQMSELVAANEDDFNLKYSLALLNKELGQRDEAKAQLKHLIQNNKRVSDAHFQLALLAEEDDNDDEAITQYGLVGKGNNLLPAMSRLTQLLSENERLQDARAYLHRQRLQYPELVVPLYRMESELLVTSKHYETAHELLTEGLGSHPDNFDLLYSRSLVSEKLNDIASVEADLRTILQHDADNPSVLNALGYTLTVHTERFEEAYGLIERALELQPNDPAIIDSMGWVLYRQGKNEDALKYLRRAMAAMPDPEVAAHLGEVLWAIGEREEAKQVWRDALEEDPESDHISETLKRLEVEL